MKDEVTLNGTQITPPDGIRDLEQQLVYDDELKGFFLTIENDLTFIEDGFDFLYLVIFSEGICNQYDFVLKHKENNSLPFQATFNGLIHISDIKEVLPARRILKVPIADNNFSSYVFNNKDIRAFLDINKSKNEAVITGATNRQIDFFTPSTGAYDYPNIKSFTVNDAFRYIIDFISDGELSYTSPFFGTGGDMEGLCILSAAALSTDATATPFFSFYELFTEMDKLFNISFRLDYSTTTPTMIIDRTANLYSETVQKTFDDVKDIKIRFDKSRLYSKITIGSSTTQLENSGAFTYPDVRFLGVKEEEYHLLGQCNTEKQLNLINDFIIDSNVIEDILINANDAYDDKIVIVQTDFPGTAQATKFANFVTADFIYNKELSNYHKAVNYLGAIPNDIVAYISTGNFNFKAHTNSITPSTGVIVHTIEDYDPGNNHSTVNGRFTCPVSGDGAYSFTWTYTDIDKFGGVPAPPTGTLLATVYMRRYSSGGALLQSEVIEEILFEPDFIFVVGGGTIVFSLVAGEYVVVEFVKAAVGYSITFPEGTVFRGDFIDLEGGVFQTYDPSDYKIFNIEFETKVKATEFNSILQNITQQIRVTEGKNSYKGWVKSLQRNIYTGETKFTLITSNNSRI